MLVRPLARELTLLVLIKVLALVLLFYFFFGPSHRPNIDADATARNLLSDGTSKEAAPQ